MTAPTEKPKPAPMTKGGAVRVILAAARSQRRSNAEAKRIAKACDTLLITSEDRRYVFWTLEYCDDDGKPYDLAITRLW